MEGARQMLERAVVRLAVFPVLCLAGGIVSAGYAYAIVIGFKTALFEPAHVSPSADLDVLS